jgi:hypothetical protein
MLNYLFIEKISYVPYKNKKKRKEGAEKLIFGCKRVSVGTWAHKKSNASLDT